MEVYKNLSELCVGERGVVSEIGLQAAMKRRLQDMGMINGTEVECVGKSPFGDPAAYLLRSTVIALRGADAGQVKMKVVV